MKMDDINLEILRHLRAGRKSFKAIADELSLTENTVRARVNKMTEEGLLEITGLVDAQQIPGHQLVFIGVRMKTMNLSSKGKELSTLKGVISVNIVTGKYDFILIVLLKEDYSLLNFFTEEISKVEDILSSETFVIYKSFNMKIPYVL